MKISLLHGYEQTSQLLREKTGVLRKALNQHEFIYIDAPFKLSEEKRTWWNKDSKEREGLDQSLEMLEETLEDVDGVIGFSQGAVIAYLLSQRIKLRFVILISGYAVEELDEPSELISVPSLHVYGLADKIVLPEKSKALTKKYVNPEIIEHEGGHYIPQGANNKKRISDFILTNSK